MTEPEPVVRLTRTQVREIDRRAIAEYQIPGILLMENAARGVVDVALQMMRRVSGAYVLILCGGGNNGGDGLAVARHLHNREVNVVVLPVGEPRYSDEALVNWNIVRAMRINTSPIGLQVESLLEQGCDLVVDAMLGTGLTEPVRRPFDVMIEKCNRCPAPILAVDLPSGMDCDTGRPLGACVRAMRTVTFVAEKAGFANPEAQQYTGEINVVDIGCPRELIDIVRREVS
jgi:NAD(P)H-hydrate epimerase